MRITQGVLAILGLAAGVLLVGPVVPASASPGHTLPQTLPCLVIDLGSLGINQRVTICPPGTSS